MEVAFIFTTLEEVLACLRPDLGGGRRRDRDSQRKISLSN